MLTVTLIFLPFNFSLIFLVLHFLLMPLGMFQNPLHLISSLINCIYSTQEYFFISVVSDWFFFITCYSCLMFLMPSCMILRIFIGIIINSCCSNSSVLLPLELVVQFVISAFQCFTSVFIRCLSSSHSFWNIGYSFYIKFSVPSVSHFALEDSPELDSTEESHSFFKFPVSTLL